MAVAINTAVRVEIRVFTPQSDALTTRPLRPAESVCLSVCHKVSLANTDELIVMPSEVWTLGAKEPCIRWGSVSHTGRALSRDMHCMGIRRVTAVDIFRIIR